MYSLNSETVNRQAPALASEDMTRRDLQLVARDKGRPWDLGKDVEQSSVCSEIVPMPGVVIDKGELCLSVERPRQTGRSIRPWLVGKRQHQIVDQQPDLRQNMLAGRVERVDAEFERPVLRQYFDEVTGPKIVRDQESRLQK